MKFDIESLRTLQVLSETGNLQATADRLCISRSAVSVKLKRLQQRTGCTLVQRAGRGLQLTDDGAELLGYAREILDAHDAAVRRFLPVKSTGTVRVGATEGAGNTPLLDTVAPWLRRSSPDIDLRVTIEQPKTIEQLLAEGRIDIALTIVPDDQVGDDDIVLSRDELVWAHGAGTDFDDVRPLPLITWGPRCFVGALATQLLTSAAIEHRVQFELSTIASVQTALSSGAGVALLNYGILTDEHAVWTGPAAPPAAPNVAYVLRQAPGASDDPLRANLVEEIRSSFLPYPAEPSQ